MYTLDTYQEQFKGFNQDVLDEIRSSIFDNVDLRPYLTDDPQQDSYRLQQVRVSLKEGISDRWVGVFASGAVLRRLRGLHRRGINLTPINELIEDNVLLSEEYYTTLLDIIEEGLPIPEDFSIQGIPKRYLQVIQPILRDGLFNNQIFLQGGLSSRGVYRVSLLLKKLQDRGLLYLVKEDFYQAPEDFFTAVLKFFNTLSAEYISYLLGDVSRVAESWAYIRVIYRVGEKLGGDRKEAVWGTLYGLPGYQVEAINQGTAEGYDVSRLLERGMSLAEVKACQGELALGIGS